MSKMGQKYKNGLLLLLNVLLFLVCYELFVPHQIEEGRFIISWVLMTIVVALMNKLCLIFDSLKSKE